MENVKGKRELIIEAAERIFSQKGFFQAKVEEIAAEAGVGKGTVYEYFSSKEEVFKEMLIHVCRDFNFDFQRDRSDCTAVEKIKDIVQQHLNFMMQHKDMARVLMQEKLTLSEDLFEMMRETRDNNLKFLENIVVEGIENGEFRQDIKPKVTAHLIFGATVSLSGDFVVGDPAMSIETLTDTVIDMIMYGMVSPKRSIPQ